MGRYLSGLIISAVALAGPFLTAARADFLGSQISWQYYAYGGAYTYPGGETGGTFTDNGGVGGTFIGNPGQIYFNIVSDGDSITFDYSVVYLPGTWSPSPLSLAPTIYSGVALDFPSGAPLSSVSIDPATNMAGFNSSDLSFTGNSIEVNWQNLSFDNNTIVKLDIAGGNSTVPEPATMLLAIPALAAAWWFRRGLSRPAL